MKNKKRDEKRMAKSTHEEFINRMSKLNKNIKILGMYNGVKNKIETLCLIDNHIWYPTPRNLLRGSGCPECFSKIRGLKIRKTHEEFIREFNLINKDIEILGQYEKSNKNILCKCKKCNKELLITPNSLLRGSGCKYCSQLEKTKNHTKTHEQFKQDVYEQVQDEYEVIGKYIKSSVKISMKHNICGNTYDVTPRHFLSNRRCPYCNKNTKRNNEQFIEELKIRNKNIIALDNYIGSMNKIRFKCKIHECIWITTPASIFSGRNCPICSASKGELKISDFLNINNIKFIPQYMFDGCKNKISLRFDFAIFDKKDNLLCALEYDGAAHYQAIDYWGWRKSIQRNSA